MALAVMAGLWAAGASAQQAVELRPGLMGDEAAAPGAEALPPDPYGSRESIALAPPETRLTVGPEPPPEAPVVLRRAGEDEPYAPLGLGTGALRLYPAIGIGGVYTDNVNISPSAPESDYGLRVAPELRIESDWVRHALNLSVAGDFVFFESHPEYNDTSFDANAGLRLDMRRDTSLDLAAGYHLSESYGSSSEVPVTATSKRLDQSVNVSAGLVHRFSRVIASLVGEASWYVYGDVERVCCTTEINTDRNYVQPGARLRLGYELSPAVVPFAEIAYQPRIHELSVDRSGLRRDSQGGYLRAGLALNAADVWSGEVALRYDYRDYADDRLGTVSAVGLDANLTWRPSRLTTLTFTASSGLDETADVGASAIREWTGRAVLAHRLRDNLVVSTGVGADLASYQGFDRNEVTLTADVAVSYLLGRNVELVADYAFTRFIADAPGGDYDENRVSAGVRFRL